MWRVVFVVVLAVSAQPALATPASDAYARGETLYAETKYLAAAAAFEEAYALDPDPATLFNIAQAYRFGTACAKAVDYYKRFLAAGNVPNADKVRGYIVEQERCAKQKADTAASRPTTQPARPAQPAQSDNRVEPPQPTVSGGRGKTRRIVGIGIGTLGLAAVGGGVYFGLEARGFARKRDACNPSNTCSTDDYESYEADGKAADRKLIISCTIGAVALASGITLYVLGRRAATRAEHASVVVVPDRGGALAIGSWRF